MPQFQNSNIDGLESYQVLVCMTTDYGTPKIHKVNMNLSICIEFVMVNLGITYKCLISN